MKRLISFCLIVFFVSTSVGFAAENTSRTMASGTFGVAWLNEDGILCVHDGNGVLDSIPTVKAYAVTAGDLFEDGEDQLIYLDDARKSLNIYRFTKKEKLGPFGHNVCAMTVGRCSGEESFPSLFVCTFSGDSFRWTKNVMEKGWISVPGMFSRASSGNLDHRSLLDDFAVIDSGAVYIYSSKWQTYSTVVGDKDAVDLIVGNVSMSPGDEIVFFDKEGSVFLYQNRKIENLNQKAQCLTFGKNGEELDTLYALDITGKIVAYDRESNVWKNVPTGETSGFTAIVAKTSPDGKTHALYAVAGGNLYRIDKARAEKLSSEKPLKLVLSSNDKPVAEYRFAGVPFKPYIQTLRTPEGRNVLRDAPWDHLHHHALMFAVSANGCDFWGEFDDNRGTQATVQLKPEPGVKTDSLETEIDWNLPGTKNVLKETRKIKVRQTDKVTLLDWETTLTSNENIDLGGDHYYGLGIRFDESMDRNGRFFNNTGKHDGEIVRGDERLKPCQWSAYTSKLDGKPVTVAIFDNPANPIPMIAFTMGDHGHSFAYISATLNLHREPKVLKPGQPLTFRYCVAVWEGEISQETVEEAFNQYCQYSAGENK